MKRNARIIQINGFKGLLQALFIISCLIAGFVGFPAYVVMNVWNKLTYSYLPTINFYQGILLWSIIVMLYFAINKHSFAISFGSPKGLDENDMNILMQRIQAQSQAELLKKSINETKEENKQLEEESSNK